MLDTITKKRIDDCRDILVGKLPDPKAQIEQITIGLIYKFMDDMDKESIELGGTAKFFSGDYAIYAWDKLFDTKVTAAEMLRLYSEAIESMEKNPNIPQLFRDIFNNAYLPYRDPETLKLFLKTIGEFEYTHSEKLGDAFEYLLSVMGSQGDAGQFRTPRHIIDFLVALIDPDKGDTILDPACGTAGFLISAYKHILLKYSSSNKKGLNVYEYNKLPDHEKFPLNADKLTPDDRKKLIQNFAGYDISPDMVRLSLVNLYLHGFSDPHINEYDTLSSEERWNENFDIVLANPPFMSPKGGIRPHKKFTISSNRSEVLFVDYIAEHLNPKGKAGIIVPEGIIFQSGTAYKDLRKMLVENHLYAVVSLPAGVFNPYSGVKTSILLMNREIAKKRDDILFIKIDNDGYNLGAQRASVKGSQLEEAIHIAQKFEVQEEFEESLIANTVLKTRVAANGEFNLSGERYKDTKEFKNTDTKIVTLAEVANLEYGFTDTAKDQGDARFIRITDINESGQLKMEAPKFISLSKDAQKFILKEGDILVARTGATYGKTLLIEKIELAVFASFLIRINVDKTKMLPKYYWVFAQSDVYWRQASNLMTGGGQPQFNGNALKQIQIPLPPLSVQEEIVAEIEGYQKIIDGAKAVVANYNPKIDIDPSWEMVPLGDIATLINGRAYKKEELLDEGPIPVLRVGNFFSNRSWYYSDMLNLPDDKYCDSGDLLYAWSASFGPKIWDGPKVIYHYHIWKVEIKERIEKKFLFYLLEQDSENIKSQGSGIAMIHATKGGMEERRFPVPPLKTQNQIIARIEKEQELVNANKQLIEIFEQKIKDRIAKVWGASPEETIYENDQIEAELPMAAEPAVSN